MLDRHMRKVQLCNTTHVRLIEARNKVLELLTADAVMVLWLASTATEDHCHMPVSWHI